MASFPTQSLHLIGSKKCRQGTDWIYDHLFQDSIGNDIDMSSYQPGSGGSVRMAVKDSTGTTTYLSTALATITLSWTGINQLSLFVPAAASDAVVGPLPNSCIYQVEGIQGPTGRVDRLLEGRFQMDKEVVETGS